MDLHLRRLPGQALWPQESERVSATLLWAGAAPSVLLVPPAAHCQPECFPLCIRLGSIAERTCVSLVLQRNKTHGMRVCVHGYR